MDINAEERTAQVEPGVILNTLNRKAAGVGLQFGPDPASAERATMGGSLSNNATGAHSIIYGMAADHLLSASVILSDGSLCDFGSVPLEHARKLAGISDEADRISSAEITQSRQAIIYRSALDIREKYSTAIRQRWPITWRRASGYSLNYLLPFSPTQPPLWSTWDRSTSPLPYPPVAPNTINLAPLLAGSEGTLAVIRHATLRLVPLPKYTVLGVLAYPDLVAACEAAPNLLDHNPSAIELIPQSLILLARSVPAYAAQLSFINQLLINGEVPSALLVVEFAGDNLDELRAQAARLAPGVFIADTQAIQRQVWGVRKVAMGLLSSRPGNLKSIAFIEDLAVPVSHLGEFVREMQRILAENNTTGEFAAHASAGCLHIRPMLDLGAPGGTTTLRKIAQEAVGLTIRLGGSVSGEHGDGLARSEWLQQMYGAELIQAFRALKRAADPQNLLNPGKILDAQPLDTNLRVEKMNDLRDWRPVMDFSRQAGISGAIELCNGAGVCRKTDGVMCPSFQVMQEEIHSTRGRANLLRAMIYAGENSPDLAELSASVFEALDLCLACKGCKAECPSAVDIARLKYEFLYTYYQNNPRKLRDYLFAYIGRFTRLGQPFAPILNPLLGSRPVKFNSRESVWGISGTSTSILCQKILTESSRQVLSNRWRF